MQAWKPKCKCVHPRSMPYPHLPPLHTQLGMVVHAPATSELLSMVPRQPISIFYERHCLKGKKLESGRTGPLLLPLVSVCDRKSCAKVSPSCVLAEVILDVTRIWSPWWEVLWKITGLYSRNRSQDAPAHLASVKITRLGQSPPPRPAAAEQDNRM